MIENLVGFILGMIAGQIFWVCVGKRLMRLLFDD